MRRAVAALGAVIALAAPASASNRPHAYWLPDRSTTVSSALAQLRAIAAAGYGGVDLEPGGVWGGTDIAGPHLPGPGWSYEYLSEEWFAFLGAILDEADRLGLEVFLLDTPFTMSGGAQGRVAEPWNGGDPSRGWTTLVEVVPGAVYEPVTRPYWTDPLDPDAVRAGIDANQGEHARRGLLPDAFWSDEVSFRPTLDPGTIGFGREARQIPWSDTFPDAFRAAKGYDLTPALLRHVFAPDPRDPVSRRTSYDYWDVVSHRFADAYYGQLAAWSAANGIGSIGQTINEERTSQHFAAEGSYFLPAAHPSIASSDLIGDGSLDMLGAPVCGNDACYGTTQKLASSAAHLFGRDRVHLEAYDLANDELKMRPRTLKTLIDHSIVRGVNLISLHAWNGDGGGYGERNVLFGRSRLWTDHITALQDVFTGGTTVPDVALGYPIEAYWAGDRLDPDIFAMTAGLLGSSHREFDIVPVDLLFARGYPSVVMPDWSTASVASVDRMREYVADGGTLVIAGRTPVFEPSGDDAGLASAVASLVAMPRVTVVPAGPPGRPQDVVPSDLEPFRPVVDALPPARVRVEGDPLLPSGISAIETMAYRKDGADVFFVSNFPGWGDKPPGHLGYGVDLHGQPADIVLDLPASGIPERVEAGEAERIWVYRVEDGRLRIPLHLDPFGSAAIRLAPGDPASAPHVLGTNMRDVRITPDGAVEGYADGPAFATLEDGRRLEADAPTPPSHRSTRSST